MATAMVPCGVEKVVGAVEPAVSVADSRKVIWPGMSMSKRWVCVHAERVTVSHNQVEPEHVTQSAV